MTMFTPEFARRRVVRSIVWGALGFGVGFALAGAVSGALSRQVHDFDTGRALGTVLYALAGAMGGATLGWANKSKGTVYPLMLAGALGCGLGTFITSTIVSVYVDEHISGYLAWDIADTIQFAAIGALTGALLGIVQGSWRQTFWLTVAGMLGFGLYYWCNRLLFATYPFSRLIPGSMGEVWHDSIAAAITWSAWGATGGVISGACLGIANAMRGPGPGLKQLTN
jgi:MFS family permease